MPLIHVQDYDRQFIGLQFPEHPILEKPRCSELELDWLRCADGLGWKRAQIECKVELEDFWECTQGNKKVARQGAILKQRKKLIKEGNYTLPPEHR